MEKSKVYFTNKITPDSVVEIYNYDKESKKHSCKIEKG